MNDLTIPRCKLIGGKIAGYRIARGLTQEELAAKLHMSRTTLNRIEQFSNIKDLSIGVLIEIAQGLEINPQLLLDCSAEEMKAFLSSK